MKGIAIIGVLGVILIAASCKEKVIEQPKLADEIVYQSVDLTINGVGEKTVQIPFDDRLKFKFEIMNLKDHNENWQEENLDTLAVLVSTNFAQVLDDSEFGYLNALIENTIIDEQSGFWNHRQEPLNYALSTTNGVGEFKGAGDRYFGFRLSQDGGFIYGWFLVNCSENSNHLEIKAYAYNKTINNAI